MYTLFRFEMTTRLRLDEVVLLMNSACNLESLSNSRVTKRSVNLLYPMSHACDARALRGSSHCTHSGPIFMSGIWHN